MTAALVGFGGGRTGVVTAVLLYRVLTFVPTIVVGSVCALIWRHEDKSLHLRAKRLSYPRAGVRRRARRARARRRPPRTRQPAPRWAASTRSGRACPSGSGSRPAVDERERRGRLARIHVAGAERRAPAGDRHERDIDRGRERGHVVVQAGVAREVGRLRAGDEVADRGRPGGGDRGAAVVVVGLERRDCEASHGGRARRPRSRARAPRRAAELAEPGRRDQQRVAGDPAKRRRVEMVAVGVRDEHRVDSSRAASARSLPPQMGDPRPQDRVGEDPDAVEVEQQGGVSDIGDVHQQSLIPTGRATSLTHP